MSKSNQPVTPKPEGGNKGYVPSPPPPQLYPGKHGYQPSSPPPTPPTTPKKGS